MSAGDEGPLKIAYDERNDILEVEGIKYSGHVFRYFGLGTVPGSWIRIIKREDGVAVVEIRDESTISSEASHE